MAAENWTAFLSRPLANHSSGSRIQNRRAPNALLGDLPNHNLCFIGDSRVRVKRKPRCWFGKAFNTRRYGWFPTGDNRPGKYTRGLAASSYKGWLLESGRSPRNTSVEALDFEALDFEAFPGAFLGLTRSGASSGFLSSDRSSRLGLGFSLALKASSISFLTSANTLANNGNKQIRVIGAINIDI